MDEVVKDAKEVDNEDNYRIGYRDRDSWKNLIEARKNMYFILV